MSTLTTIERRVPRLPFGGIAIALLVWFGGMAMLAFVRDPSAVVAFGPSATTMEAAERSGALLVSAGRGFVTVRPQKPGTVRALYASGAWFVWPVFRAGCGN